MITVLCFLLGMLYLTRKQDDYKAETEQFLVKVAERDEYIISSEYRWKKMYGLQGKVVVNKVEGSSGVPVFDREFYAEVKSVTQTISLRKNVYEQMKALSDDLNQEMLLRGARVLNTVSFPIDDWTYDIWD